MSESVVTATSEIMQENKEVVYACQPQTPGLANQPEAAAAAAAPTGAEQEPAGAPPSKTEFFIEAFTNGKLERVKIPSIGDNEALTVPEDASAPSVPVGLSEADRLLASDYSRAMQETDRCLREHISGQVAPLYLALVAMLKRVRNDTALPFIMIKRRVSREEAQHFEATLTAAAAATPPEADCTKETVVDPDADQEPDKKVEKKAEAKKKLGDWHPLTFHDMRSSDDSARFDPSFVDAYAALRPLESGVFLFVIEMPFYNASHSMIIWMRTAVHIAVASEASKDHVPLAERQFIAGGKSIAALRVTRSINISPVRAVKPSPSLLEKETVAAKEAMLRASQHYEAQRHAQRRTLIGRQLPAVNNLVFVAFSTVLNKRKLAAAPHVPQPLLIKLPIERSGAAADLDASQHIDLPELKALREQKNAKIAELMGPFLAAGADAAAAVTSNQVKPPGTPLSAKEEELELMRDRLFSMSAEVAKLDNLIAALSNISPATSVLLLVTERGFYQDVADKIEFLYTLKINYEALQSIIDRVESQKQKEKVAEAAAAAVVSSAPDEKQEAAVAAAVTAESEIKEEQSVHVESSGDQQLNAHQIQKEQQ